MRRSKKIKFYIVTPVGGIGTLTITEKREQAEEYINKVMYIQNKDHFNAWCELRGMISDPRSPKFNESWIKYYNTCIKPNPPKLVVKPMSYELKDMLTVLRVYSGCIPIGCSFDDQLEMIAYMTKIGPVEESEQIEVKEDS